MKRFIFAFLTIISVIQLGFSQKQLPIIKASSYRVYIRLENAAIDSNNRWKILPKVRPDIYRTSHEKVTFYTDLDSISFKIKPKSGYYVEFVILLNGDSAYTRIEYQVSYTEKLREAKKYNYSDIRFVPEFTYQSSNNPNLTKIREELKLDSIAAKGSEISKILNLMHWLHNTVRHMDNEPPKVKNAIDLIRVCKTENRGLNCRMQAIILNECYLAMGFKSRYVICMPKETNFDDCHVINMVYSNDLRKWIWVDPTCDAYVMDENGVLLSIEEVREKLIKNEHLIINPDANWGREYIGSEYSQTKQTYLNNYMAKNLYRLQTPLISEYNAETWETGKEITYVELLPLDGIEQTPQKSEYKDENTGVKFTNYKTNNPNLFWIKPE